MKLSDEANLEKHTEAVVEAFCVVQLLGCLSLQPDLQYIVSPGGTMNPSALTVG